MSGPVLSGTGLVIRPLLTYLLRVYKFNLIGIFPYSINKFPYKGLRTSPIEHQWMKKDDEDHMRSNEKRSRAALELCSNLYLLNFESWMMDANSPCFWQENNSFPVNVRLDQNYRYNIWGSRLVCRALNEICPPSPTYNSFGSFTFIRLSSPVQHPWTVHFWLDPILFSFLWTF